ncbi:hypothetical protein [Arthrobacter antioxidans]|uniref:hypothetical protein n=1 Tax=Arthrobacter antioxidans TaxID=2895818 RepID=UPI001FFEE29B|nr:hypothetical protein [Arthrobacter antioxidans]
MRIQNTLCFSLLATLSLVAGTVASATAAEEEPAAPWPPADTDGEYLPVPDEYYDPIAFPACGTNVTMTSGDVQDVHYKSRVKRDGSTVVKFRGSGTVDLTADPGGDLPDGGFIDELDVSGPGSQRISADKSVVVEALVGPSIVYPVSATDSAALDRGGFPELFYFDYGKLKIKISLSEDEDAVEPDSVEIVRDTTRGVVDLCRVLEDSTDHS